MWRKNCEMKILMIKTAPVWNDGLTSVVEKMVRYVSSNAIKIDVVAVNEPSKQFKDIVEKRGGNIYIVQRHLSRPLHYVYELSRIIKRNQYDIVHAHGNSSTLALELLAAKIGGCGVRIAHSHNTSCKYIFLHRLLRPLFNAMYTTGFACSENAGKWLFGKRHFTIINNAIELNKFVFDLA